MSCTNSSQKISNDQLTKISKDEIGIKNSDSGRTKVVDNSSLKNEKTQMIKKAWEAINSNNENSYQEVSTWYRFHPVQNEFMYYSVLMAYKNNSSSAYYDIFRFYNKGAGVYRKSDTTFLNFLLYNMARSNELGYDIGEWEIEGITINKKNIKSSGYYLKKLPHKD